MPAFAPREVLDPRIAMARTNPGSRFNSAGMFEMAPANSPRFDYDPKTVTSRNLFIASEFQTGLTGVTRSGAAVSVGDMTTFPGFDTGLLMAPSAAQDYCVKYPVLQPNTAYCFSIFVRMESGLAPNLPVAGSSTANDFCLAVINGYSGAPYLVENFGYGVYRVSVTFTTPNVIANNGCGVYCQANGPTGRFLHTGWQMNKGTLPGDYIPTLDVVAGNAMARGVLVEENKTNLLLQSEDITVTSVWSGFNGGIRTLDNSGPGGAKATTLTGPTSSGVFVQTAVTTATSVTYSLMVKKNLGDNTSKNFLLRNGTTGVNFNSATWEPSTGVISGAGWTSELIEDGWYLLTYTQSTGITVGDNLVCYVGVTGAALPASWSLKVSCPQLEIGLSRTTYIPTTTARVVRGADLLSVPAATLKYKQTEGTIFFEGLHVMTGLSVARIGVNLGTEVANRHLLYSDSRLLGYAQWGGAGVTNQQGNAVAGARMRAAMTWDSTGFWLSINGADTTFTTASLPVNPEDKLWIGGLAGGAPWNGVISAVEYYPRKLTPAQIKAMSTL